MPLDFGRFKSDSMLDCFSESGVAWALTPMLAQYAINRFFQCSESGLAFLESVT